MAIQFIIGGSGTGKTSYIYEEMIRESMKADHRPILYILPEQSNMSAEQEMVKRHPNGGTMDISILSFTRLSFMVFDELGIKTNDILDDYGKSMVIRRVLGAVNEQLGFYKNCGDKPGFIEEIKKMISEFYQYQLQGAALDKAIQSLDPNTGLYYKMKDLQLIFNAFSEYLSDQYMVAEQVLSLLTEVAEQSRILKDAMIYMDGFSGFTPIQYGVLEELLKLGCDIRISFTISEDVIGNNDYGEQELFSACKREYDKLCYLAAKHQVTILPHVLMKENYRLKNAAGICHLEQHLFRFPTVVCNSEIHDIHGITAKSPGGELAFVANQIKAYVAGKGYRYRDFAIITNDISGILYDAKHYMEQMEIPYFMDYNEPLVHNPMSELVRLLFELYKTDFSYKSVFSFLKTGILNIPMTDIFELENYVIKYGIRGFKRWSQPFRGGVKGLKRLNTIRKKFMEDMEDLSVVFKKERASGKAYIEGLYRFICAHHVAENLNDRSLEFEQKGMLREADVYRQIYGKWIELLDKTVDILGDEIISRNELARMLGAGLETMQLGIIPSTLDQVVIGDLERTRLHDIKVLFVVGVNDGLLPKLSGEGSILLDKDRKTLQSLDINIAPDSMENLFMQQYAFYLQVTKAGEEVYFCFHRTDQKGNEVRPSYYLNQILAMFPNIELMDCEDLSWKNAVSKNQLLEDFSHMVMGQRRMDTSLYHIMEERYGDDLKNIIDGYLYQNTPEYLRDDLIKGLYGNQMLYSVSKLESFSRCAFAFFLQYGLKIKKREEYKVESNNIGTILHEVMELFFASLRERKLRVSDLTKEQRDELVEQLTVESAKRENETIFDSDYRNRHQLDVLIRVAKRSIDNLCRHVEKGNMEPAYFEKEFSPKDKLKYIRMALEDDIYMELKGVVDRVDIKETKDSVYFKIIDYKSGEKDIDYLSVYEGKQLQLAVYMSVMKELLERQYPEKNVIPTGMYYYHMQDKIIEEQEDSRIEKARVENSKLTGLANVDETCRDLMDGMTGEVSPVKYKQNGELSAQNRSLVSTDELNNISSFVRDKMMDIGKEIIHGQISMNPEKGEYACPCNYCDYKSICRFEPGLGGNRYRVQPKISDGDAKNQVLHYGKEMNSDAVDK